MPSAQHHYLKATQILASLKVVGDPTAGQMLAAQIAQAEAMLAAVVVAAEATLGRAVVLDADGPHQGPS